MRRLVITLALAATSPVWAQRVVVPLDGDWEIEESVDAARMPQAFTHKAPVPGLANQATPAFSDVDLFDSVESIDKKVRLGMLPASARINNIGIPRQKRNYFWYRTTFRAPARKEAATLKVNKAQFGVSVWLNGKKIGDYLGCFTAGYFDLTPEMDWAGNNTLIVRVGAHPGVMPENVPCGTDNEKLKWTPGIYDSVSVLLGSYPLIESVQVAPRIQSSEIVIETVLRNGPHARSIALAQTVSGQRASERVSLAPAQRKNRAADAADSRREALDARDAEPVHARDIHRRRLGPHAVRHARDPL